VQRVLGQQEVGRPEGLPVRWLGAGPLHKVRVPAKDATTLGDLRARGALVRTIEYGAFTLALVDERPLGGRAALERLGLEVRDEYDLIAFDGLVVDGRRPELALSTLEAGERFTRPGDPRLDPHVGLYVLQFEGPVRDEWLDELAALGVDVVQHVPMNAFVVAADPSLVARLEGLARATTHVQYVGAYEPAFRMQAGLRAAVRAGVDEPWPVTVQLIDGPGVRAALAEVAGFADEVGDARMVGDWVNVDLVLRPVFFRAVAANPRVFGLELRGVRVRTDEVQGRRCFAQSMQEATS
jgi:hypothetical protein